MSSVNARDSKQSAVVNTFRECENMRNVTEKVSKKTMATILEIDDRVRKERNMISEKAAAITKENADSMSAHRRTLYEIFKDKRKTLEEHTDTERNRADDKITKFKSHRETRKN